MSTEAVITASEYLASLGIDVAKEKVKKKIDEKKLRAVLTSYIESQSKYNEMCSLAEEIDFQGLVDYIRNNLISNTVTRVFDPNKKKRSQARQDIVSAAIAFSKANTDEAKLRVSKCISMCLDIIHNFYASTQLSMRDYLRADMVVDAVAEEVHESTMATVAALNEAKDQILTTIAESGSLFSIDKAVELAENGNVGAIGAEMQKVLAHISLNHPFAPDFGYDYKNGMIVSKPLTAEAKKRYPPKIVLTGAVKIGGEYFNNPKINPLNYAYRHQIPIAIEVSNATKLLGEKTDPSQDEVQGIIGRTIFAKPPEFLPAIPCAIMVRDKSFYNFVLLRTQEIEDDGTYVISNKEQRSSFYFEVRINPCNPSKPVFNINMNNANNHELLKYVQFMSALSKERDIHIYMLSQGKDFIAGHINGVDHNLGFLSFEEEIDFFERVCSIEDYFHIQLSVPREISNREYNIVVYISDLIRNDQVTGTWNEVTFTVINSQHFRKKLTTLDKELHMLSYIGVGNVDLFGVEFKFRFMRSYKSATLTDLDKIKRKAEILDDGDNIKITFRAGNDKMTIDTLKIPESFNNLH